MSYPDNKPATTPDRIPAHSSDVIATPEGDNEFAPDEPLNPYPYPIERPRGNEPHFKQPIRPAQ